jgi:ABC-2 type transport system permease protein
VSADTPAGALTPRRSYARELSALRTLFGLTLRQYTHGRRLLILAALYALPCGLAVLLRSLRPAPPPEMLEFALVFNLLPHGLAPLTALLYASGVIQDEVEEQTLTYLLLRPMPRWALYVTRLLAALCMSTLLVAAGTVALYVAVYWGTPGHWGDVLLTRVPRVVAIFALAQVGYCALFGFLGMVTRRSLVAGVIYIAAIEGAVANIDFVARALTVSYYVRTLVVRWLRLPEPTLARWRQDWGLDLDKVPPAGECAQKLLAFGLALTALTALWFARREFRMKTPEGT